MKGARQTVVGLVLVAVALYAAFCLLLFVKQRSLIYYPQPRANRAGVTVMRLPSAAGAVLVSTWPKAGSEALIYFGGNAEDVSQEMPELAATFPKSAIYLLHYPGYGGSAGTPSERAIVADAEELFDRVHAEHPDVVVVGRSLGSGVAVHLASIRPVMRLVLVTPFDSLADVAASHFWYFPVRWLMQDRYDSWRYAPKVGAPTRIIAAGDDEVIPRPSTERLRTRFRDGVVSYVVVPGVGHNTISESAEYWGLLK